MYAGRALSATDVCPMSWRRWQRRYDVGLKSNAYWFNVSRKAFQNDWLQVFSMLAVQLLTSIYRYPLCLNFDVNVLNQR